uniref:Crystaline entomocidal protoxin n=3 Tax=Bacillus thuringiensis TaxID=1428 RepID=L0GEB4_BACTU|nr:insecticidal delta-endotoxin Cry8Ea1 family protein [Bacillus thuringiensis]ADW78573.1 Cry8-like protein [Bacillus thuringiensis]AGA83483.1 Cry8 [Bacillus thuringiensis]AOB42309.1 Cry8Qa2 [Bacillus thuringiensis]
MSPNNQNEYEIIDATPSTSVTNDSTRYPFANDPTNTLQNMNYKDYLRMSDSYSPEYLTSPVPFSQFGTVDQIISIIGLLNSAAGIPGLDFVTGLLQFILDFFAPEDPWAELMEIVEQLIDQKITESTRDKAFAELRGLLNGYLVYQQSLESWLENPNAARSSIVREQFVALELDFVTSIPSFAITGQEIPLLAVFAQAANLHLLLMRDASVFGERWGLKESEVNTYYNRQMTYTEQYSDYCVKIYNTGLNQLKGTSSSDWIEYNRFRREMTLLVLDAVAIFPSYDMRRYPVATKTEFTRIVYTDPLGFDMKKGVVTNGWTSVGPSFSSIELLTGSPDLFKWLEKLEIFSKRISEPSVFINSWAGHTISQFLTGTSSTTSTTTHGNTANPVQRFVVDTRKQGYIYQTIAYPHAVNTNVFFLFGVPKVIFGLIGVGISGPTAPNLTFSDSTGGNLESIERDSTSELPPIESSSDTPQPIQDTYSHRLDSAAMITTNKSYGSGYIPLLGWTHRSVDRNNTIYPDKITQIPIVKAQELGHVPIPGPPISEVVPGPGFTGGDILHVQANGQFISKMTVNVQNINKEYIMRIRYASITDRVFYLNATGTPVYSSAQKTMNSGEPLTYDKFNYATSSPIKFSSTNLTIALGSSSNIYGSAIETYIDRIEFIPVDETYEAEQDLENAKKAVNALFTNTKDGLRPGVTDYEVNQAANLVECLSDDLYPNEKRLLFDAVREAKRLSEARNLLQDPDFQEINGENGWTASTGIEVVEGDALFKGRYLRLPGARQIDTETYPTYLYQKIDEGVLKPYTRYRLRGFVGRSQGLEIYTIRHQTNRIVKNVPDNLLPDASPGNAGDGINRCSEQKYVNSRLEGEKGLPNGSRSAEAHEFSLPIDIGEIDYNENAGVWVGFKITDPEGYATLGNLELVEEGPLLGDTLERVKREEQQWKIQMTKRREETDRKYMIAKQAVDRLYADYQDQQLNPNVEITDITAAQNVIQSIPYVYNDAFPGLPGMNYTKFTELTDRLQQAWSLYDQRNAIPNGDFRNELSNWNTTAGVNVQQLNGTSVLVIPNWDAQVSQQFTVQPNQRYVLRVTARKEGVGNGYVSIRDGGNQTETLTFSASDYDTNGVYNIQASNTNGYNTNGVYNDQTGYITKTAEFIPHTNQVWIEMSETEGTFYIESVELIVDVE